MYTLTRQEANVQTLALCALLALLSRTAASFPPLVEHLNNANDDRTLGGRIKSLIPRIDAQGSGSASYAETALELADLIVDLLEVVCIVGDGRVMW